MIQESRALPQIQIPTFSEWMCGEETVSTRRSRNFSFVVFAGFAEEMDGDQFTILEAVSGAALRGHLTGLVS